MGRHPVLEKIGAGKTVPNNTVSALLSHSNDNAMLSSRSSKRGGWGEETQRERVFERILVIH